MRITSVCCKWGWRKNNELFVHYSAAVLGWKISVEP